MAKVNEKWNNPLSGAFGQVIRKIQLGKLRREALREMADMFDIAEVRALTAAVIQAEQLGVSTDKVLRLMSEKTRSDSAQDIDNKRIDLQNLIQFSIAILLGPIVVLWLLAPVMAQLIQ